MNLKFKSFIMLFIVPLIILLIMVVFLYFVNFRYAMDKAVELHYWNSVSIMNDVNLEISKGLEVLRLIESQPVTGRAVNEMAGIPDGLDNRSFSRLRYYDQLKSLLYNSANGTTIDLIFAGSIGAPGLILGKDVNLVEGFDVRKRDYFQAAVNSPGDFAISEPRVSAEESKEPIIVVTAAKAVIDEKNKVAGVLAYNYRINKFIEILKPLQEKFNFTITLADKKGGYILWDGSSEKEYFYNPDEVMSVADYTVNVNANRKGDNVEHCLLTEDKCSFKGNINGENIIFQSINIPDTRWVLFIGTGENAVVKSVISSVMPPIIMFVMLFMFFQIIVYFVNRRMLIRPVIRLGDSLKSLSDADADMRIQLDVETKDEVGTAAESFNKFTLTLRKLLTEIKEIIIRTDRIKDTVSSSTGETSTAIEQISSNILSIRDQVIHLNNGIQENLTLVTEINDNTQKVDSEIIDQVSMVEESNASINEMMASLNNLSNITKNKRDSTLTLSNEVKIGKEKFSETSLNFKSVVEQMDSIKQMAAAIENIATQTNLLSMNASIEAAHAGESGKGFSVVANEIRKLADSSSKSSRTISEMIQKITDSVTETDKNVEITSKAFDIIEGEVTDTVNAFTEIENSISELNLGGQQILSSTTRINDVSSTIKRQSSDISHKSDEILSRSAETKEISDRITGAMDEVKVGISEIMNSMNVMLESVNELSEVVSILKDNFGQFKT